MGRNPGIGTGAQHLKQALSPGNLSTDAEVMRHFGELGQVLEASQSRFLTWDHLGGMFSPALRRPSTKCSIWSSVQLYLRASRR